MASKAGCVFFDMDDGDAEMFKLFGTTSVFVCMFGKGGHKQSESKNGMSVISKSAALLRVDMKRKSRP